MTDLFDLTDRVAIVTGGSRGLGAEIAYGLARRGAHVVIASRDERACAELAADVTASTGNTARGIACHVGRWSDCDHLVASAYAEFGRIDVLVNNAGMSPLYRSLGEVSEELFDKVLAVNLKGPFRLSAITADVMSASGGGAIVNVTSIAAIRPRPNQIPYALAKAGLNCLTVGLAHMLGPSVRVNAVMPGPFLTDVSRSWDMAEFDQHAAVEIPLRRAGRPAEIVGAVLYLASDASSYTTGAVLKVDGGEAYAPA
jgi:NAD(P)-dependent dehydrogenase (short-subunit alcohol dehydrogenase family)